MRRVIVVGTALVVVAVAIVLVAVGLSSTPRLAAKLLPASEMPIGWQPESFANVVKGTGCLAAVLAPKGLAHRSLVDAVYVNDGSIPPEIGEALATYRHPEQAFARIIAALDRCRYVNPGDTNQSGITGSVTAVPLPGYGDASAGYQGVLSIYAVPMTATMDLAVVRQRNVVMELFESSIGIGRVDLAQFHRYIALATRRLAAPAG